MNDIIMPRSNFPQRALFTCVGSWMYKNFINCFWNYKFLNVYTSPLTCLFNEIASKSGW